MSDKPKPLSITPMLAKPGKLPAACTDFAFEIKWDGLRAITYIVDGAVTIQSRNMKDITGQYPEVQPLAGALAGKTLILDGELVALDKHGHPSFSALQHRMGLKSAKTVKQVAQSVPVTYIVFDILHLDSASTMHLPYTQRRKLLEGLNLAGNAWQISPSLPEQGRDLLTASRQLGLEGIIAKRLDSKYEAGKRSGSWIKIKNQRRQELVIAGWIEGAGRRRGKIGSVLTGYYDIPAKQAAASGRTQKLNYAGKAGTGFSDKTLAELQQLFRTIARKDSPFSEQIPEKNVFFIEPVLVGEFEFTAWTPHNTLRHPSFKGLREDKNAQDVVRE